MKEIKGYEELYGITSCGKVWSFKKNKFISQWFSNSGYAQVKLCKNGSRKNFYVHKLVAEAYIENPEGKGDVNHKDGNKTHNWVNNLEWVSRGENIQHAYDTNLRNQRHVICQDTGEEFVSCAEAARHFNIKHGCQVRDVCTGRRKTCHGLHFQFIEQED